MSIVVHEIPLKPTPQFFTIVLAGTTYQLNLQFNSVAQSWTLDIADVNGVPILRGVALVTGGDLLAQFGYLKFGGQLIIQTDFDTLAPPTFDNLGRASHVYFVTS